MPAFNNNRSLNDLHKNIHNVNIMIYISDVNLDNAPMRVLPNLIKNICNSIKKPKTIQHQCSQAGIR